MKKDKMTTPKLIAHIMVLLVIVGLIVGVAIGGESFVEFVKVMHIVTVIHFN